MVTDFSKSEPSERKQPEGSYNLFLWPSLQRHVLASGTFYTLEVWLKFKGKEISLHLWKGKMSKNLWMYFKSHRKWEQKGLSEHVMGSQSWVWLQSPAFLMFCYRRIRGNLDQDRSQAHNARTWPSPPLPAPRQEGEGRPPGGGIWAAIPQMSGS
jgi:hypothetical protein